jgi:hypothetical protein
VTRRASKYDINCSATFHHDRSHIVLKTFKDSQSLDGSRFDRWEQKWYQKGKVQERRHVSNSVLSRPKDAFYQEFANMSIGFQAN